MDALARAAGIHRLAARVLIKRGVSDARAARLFLDPCLADLHHPSLLTGVAEAAARLRRATESGEKILLYGDYDVDGTMSIVILKTAIELAGGKAQFHIPHRLKDGYGMRPEVVERAAAEGVTLIVSVDTGIRAGEVVRHAASLGIDVIVTDHHLPEAELPPAAAVLNPNRPDCRYPEKNLCGAGVVLKLSEALLGLLGWPEERRLRLVTSFLKLAAIATVADVVPLTGENRTIVKLGLQGLADPRAAGLRAILEVAGIEPGTAPTARQVAFQVAPRLNAAGRMATASRVIELMLAADPAVARRIAAELDAFNRERQKEESEIVESILRECDRAPVTDADAALVFSGPGWHRGVLGIVASRIVERFSRPVFVLGEDAESGEAHGSGRSVPPFHLLEALEAMPDLFTRFGGHRQAAGVSLPLERVDDFRGRLAEYARERLSPEDFRPVLEFDAEVTLAEIDDDSVAGVLRLEPFGFGNPMPLFALLGAEVAEEPAVFKEKHLRVRLKQERRSLIVKGWNFAQQAAPLRPGARVDAALTFTSPWSATLRALKRGQ